MNNENSHKKLHQQNSSQQEFFSAHGHSQGNIHGSKGQGDTAQNINSYQKQIKSNNQVFKQSMSFHSHIQTALQQKQQQQEGNQVYTQQVSPNIDKFRKTTNQPMNQNQIQSKGSIKDFKYGTQYTSNSKNRNKIGTQPGGQKQLQSNVINHRRSKTDGNIPKPDPETQAANEMQIVNNSLMQAAAANEVANTNQGQISQQRAQQQQQYQDINQIMINETKFLNENLQENLLQLQKGQGFMSRQQAINSNQNLIPKVSNQSAKSAQIQINHAQKLLLNKQKNDPNNNGGNRNLSVEQAAKNLKLIGGSDDIMQAPTRNSNLVSHPNKDKIKNRAQKDAHDMQGIGQLNLQNKKEQHNVNQQQQQWQLMQESKQYEINNRHDSSQQNESLLQDDSKSGQNISMDQLKQLMKNPQIAQFLKEQIEIQQQQQQSFQNSQDTFGIKSAQRLDLQDINQLKMDSLDQHHQISTQQNLHAAGEHQSSNQKILLGLGNTESNMNSDTSQEIIKYQQEWAKQFHEQVNGMTNVERQELNAMMTANSNNTQGQRSSAMDRDQSSSQFITGNPGNSHEQIMLLPESAYTHNMQKLNEKKTDFKTGHISSTNVVQRHANNNDSISEQPQNIDFYNQIQVQQSESHVDSQSPISQAINNQNLKIDDDMNQDYDNQNQMQLDQLNMQAIQQQEEHGSRNIMNGAKQLSFITICTDIMDHEAQLLLENIREDSQASQRDEDDEYLTFQLCQGEVMDNEMANFIGIHMLNDGYLEGDENSKNNDQDGGLNFQCQVTGAHFEYNDINERVKVLLDKRNVIDEAIRQEDERQKLVKNQQVMNDKNKQKQLQKHLKFKNQVKNILKSAQQDNNSNDDFNNELNDSIPNQTNHLITDDDMFVMEDEDHLQSHHVTTNMKTNQANLESQDNNSNNKSKNGKSNANGKIYHTHDGRYKQASKQQSSSKGTTNVIKTQDQSSISYTYTNQQQKVVGAFKQSGQKAHNANNFASSQNQVKIVKNQTNDNEINPLVHTNKQNYSVKAVINHGHTMQGRFFNNNQQQQKEKYSTNQISMKTSNQSMYPASGSFYQQSLKNNTKTFHVTPSQAVHQASSLASDHASKISQISKNSVAVAGTLTGKSQRIAGNSFGAIGQNHSKVGFAYTQNSGNNSNERQMQRKLQIGGGPSAVKRGGMNVSVGSGTHSKIDPHNQYNLQIKNQQQQDSINQAIYNSKKKQMEGQHGISVSGHSQQSIVPRIQMQARDEDSENGFEQMSQGLMAQGHQSNSNGVKQIFVNPVDKSHARVLSDDIKFNTSNLQKGNFQGGIAGTQIHSNQLSSLDATYAQNTHAYNTALGSQRDTVVQVGKTNGHKHPKKNVTSFDNHKNAQKINMTIGKNSGKARLIENKDSKSLGGTTSTQGNSQLRQTAQFGPQMNLIKSQLPNNNMKGSGAQNQYHSNDNKLRNQKKIQINNQKMKSTELRKNSKNTPGAEGNANDFGNYLPLQYQSQGIPVDQSNMYAGVVLKNQGQQPPQYDESGSLNKRQAMMQQANPMAFQNNQQILINDKRASKQTSLYMKNDQKGMASNKSDKVNMHQNASGQSMGQGASIYSTQQQRKQKLIYNGGNLIGYDMGRSSNQQNHMVQQQNGLSQQVNNFQPGYGMNRNISIDRTSQKSKQYSKQNVMLNQIDIKNQSNIAAVNHPKTVQSVSKKFASASSNVGVDDSEMKNKLQSQSTSGQIQKQNASSKVGGLQSMVQQQNLKESSQAGRSDGHNMQVQQQLAGQNQMGPMKGNKAQQNMGPGMGNHLQSHSFDFRQQHQSQMNRIGNYTVFRDGNKEDQTHSQAQHSRQASGIPGDFNSQHAQPRYSHPNQALRSNNMANNKLQGGGHQHAAGMGKNNLRSFDAQMNNNQHNKLMADNMQPSSQVTPGSSNIQTPTIVIQKNKRNIQQQQTSMNQRNIVSQLGANISKAKSSSLQNKKDGQSSSNSAVRATALHGSDQSYNRYSGGGNSGKQPLSNMHQSKQHQQNLAGPSHFEAQNHLKMKQGPSFGVNAMDPKAQQNMRSSFNNATDRAASMVQSSIGGTGHNQSSSGQPNNHSFANTGPNAQTKNMQMGKFEQEEPGSQNRAFGSSPFNTGGNVSMTKENFERGASGQNLANAIATKTKRLNAANRGVNCGTNARVNTFDNRGMQAQQQSQNQKGTAQGNQQQLLPQMMKQPPVDPSRGQMQQMSGGQGGQPSHQRLHSLKNIISNQQQVQSDEMSQMPPQYSVENSNVVSHQMGDSGGGHIVFNKHGNQVNRQAQPQQQQQQFQQNNQMAPGQYNSTGQQQQTDQQQIQNMDQSANAQHQSPILFAKFVNQFFLQ